MLFHCLSIRVAKWIGTQNSFRIASLVDCLISLVDSFCQVTVDNEKKSDKLERNGRLVKKRGCFAKADYTKIGNKGGVHSSALDDFYLALKMININNHKMMTS